MDSDTFRSRLVKLLQKSRKAARLYGGVSRQQEGKNAEFSELQLKEWGEVNRGLERHLRAFAESPNKRETLRRAYLLRDHYYSQWRENETSARSAQSVLLEAAKNEDYIQCSVLSRELVVLRARYQACQAVHHELQGLLNKSGEPIGQQGAAPDLPVDNSDVYDFDETEGVDSGLDLDQPQAKVLPFSPRR